MEAHSPLPIAFKPLVRVLVQLCASFAALLLSVSAMAQDSAARPQDESPAEPTPPTVVGVSIEGERRYSESALLGAFGQEVGKPFDQRAIDRGIQVLWNTFRVRVVSVDGRETDGGIEMRLVIEEMALDLEPRFVGNVRVKEAKLREWAGLPEKGGVLYLFQAPRIRERILQGYRREGFAFADVRVVERRAEIDAATGEESAPDVIFEIEEGPRVKVRDVVLHGNHSLPDSGFLFFRSGLKKLAETELRGPLLLRLFAKDFVQDELDADVVAMRTVYRDHGYLDAVVSEARLEFSDDRAWVTIHVQIDEGEPYLVRSVELVGIERYLDAEGKLAGREQELVFPEQELLAGLELAPGLVYQKKLVDADRRAVRRKYGEKGYLDHRSLPVVDRFEFDEPELVYAETGHEVDVVYRLFQGRQLFIREVRVTGNLHSQDRIIRRLVQLGPGDVADPIKIEQSRSRIEATNWFTDPQDPINHPPPDYRFIDTADPSFKDLEFFMDEGQVITFTLSGGVSTNFGAFGLVSLSQQNFDVTDLPRSPWTMIEDIAERRAFHGAGQELRITASPGTEISFFDVYFREPDLFHSHLERVSLALEAQRRFRNFQSHDEQREEFSIELGRQVGIDSSVFVGYTLGSIEVDDLDPGGEPTLDDPFSVPALLKAQEGENDLSFFEAGYRVSTIDRRNFTRRGTSFNATAKLYDEVLGSEFEFVKLESIFDYYKQLGSDPDETSDRFHLGLRLGVASAYGNDENVPYTERFNLGGGRILRGFDFRGVGPNDHGYPLGGETYAYGSLEWRRPLLTTIQPGTYREIETLHGGVFLDAGVLDPDDFSLNWSEYRASAGFLFGLSVPLPITFAFGIPIRSGKDDDEQVVSFDIGFGF